MLFRAGAGGSRSWGLGVRMATVMQCRISCFSFELGLVSDLDQLHWNMMNLNCENT